MIFFPISSFDSKKSDAGRPMHFTGSSNYPGAAELAATAAARAGADYVVFRGICNYQMPAYIIRDDECNQTRDMRASCVLVGCGLGRTSIQFPNSSEQLFLTAVKEACHEPCPLIIDADGLYWLSEYMHKENFKLPQITILTPNLRELEMFSLSAEQLASELSCIVILKGKEDIITNGEVTLQTTEKGTFKRVCGQGDVLAGCLSEMVGLEGDLLQKCQFACNFVKRAAELAFDKLSYSIESSDIIEEFSIVWKELTKEEE